MRKRTVAMYVVAALVVGVVLGSIGIASAATSTATSTSTATRLRLGTTVQAAQATLADIVAKLTGKTVTQVREERASGKSFASIASASGVSSSKIVSDTIAARKAMLGELVKQGKITQAQADAALARMTTRLDTRIGSTAAGCTGSGAGSGYGRGSGGVCGGCTAGSAATATQ